MRTDAAQSLEEMIHAADAPTLNEAGNAFAARGMWNEALACYERSRALYQQGHNERGEALVLNNLAAISYAMGDWETALLTYADALAILRRLDQRPAELLALMNLCFIKYAQGGDCPAELEQAQRLAEELEQEEPLTRIYWMRGDATLRQGRNLPAGFHYYALACLHAQRAGDDLLDATLAYVGDHLRSLVSEGNRLAALAFCDHLLSFGRGQDMGEAFLSRVDELRASLLSPPLLG